MPGNVFDEAMLLVFPELVLEGSIPQKDFEMFYGPANPWILSLAYQLGEVSIFVERTVTIIYHSAYAIALFLMARRLARTPPMPAVIIGWIVILPLGMIALAWIPAVFLGMFALLLANPACVEHAREPQKLRFFGAGLLFGAALLFRPDLAPALGLAHLPLLRSRFRLWKQWTLGLLIGLLPMLVHTIMATPTAVWHNVFYDPVFVVSQGRVVPFAMAPKELQQLVWITLACSLLNTVTAITQFRHARTMDFAFLSFNLLGLGLCYQIFQRVDRMHLAMGMMITIPLVSISIIYWIRKLAPPVPNAAASCLVITLALGVLIAVAPSFFGKEIALRMSLLFSTKLEAENWAKFGSRRYPLPHEAARFHTQAILDRLDTQSKPGERLFVGPGDLRRTSYCDIHFYYLTLPKLRPGSYFIQLNPFLADAENSRLPDDLANCDWIILNELYDIVKEPNRSVETRSGAASSIVETRFSEVFRSGPLRLLHRDPNES